ncbi:unnamed protein product [Urochloa humidicola]
MDLPPLSHQALFAAVRSADTAAVRALLVDAEASGTSLAALAAAQTDFGETALYVAAETGSEEVVRLLLPIYDLESASVRTRLDLDAFHAAAKQGRTGVVKEFLGQWPELCSVCDSSDTSPLYSAAVKDHLDVVNAILDIDDSCIRIVRKNGKKSLHTAARIGYHRPIALSKRL